MYVQDISWEDVLCTLRIPYTIRETGTILILCWFHRELHPSMVCRPPSREQANFFCYGCHAHGTITTFIEEVSLIDTLRLFLAPSKPIKGQLPLLF